MDKENLQQVLKIKAIHDRFLFFLLVFLLLQILLANPVLSTGKTSPSKSAKIVSPLYPHHNNIHGKRLNIIFIGAEYDNPKDLEKIAGDMIALRGENKYGLMQIRPFNEPGFSRHFNFWICRRIAYSGKPQDKWTHEEMWELTSGLYNEAIGDLNRQYKTRLKRRENNVCGVLLVNANPHKIPGYKYGGGSLRREGTFTVWHTENPWFSYNDMIVTHVHELAHSIPLLHDEYSGKGNIYDMPNWKTFDYGGQLYVPGSDQDRGKIIKERFLKLTDKQKMAYVQQNVPWKNYIGRGKGDLKIGVFEGGMGKTKYIYRSTKNSIMNYPYGLIPEKTLGFGVYVENLIRKKIKTEFGY